MVPADEGRTYCGTVPASSHQTSHVSPTMAPLAAVMLVTAAGAGGVAWVLAEALRERNHAQDRENEPQRKDAENGAETLPRQEARRHAAVVQRSRLAGSSG